MSMIEIKNVSKKFGQTSALKGVTLSLEANKIYGLLGRNGAGKTTLVGVLTNKLFADTGEVYIEQELAEENDQALAKISCMTVENYYPQDLKVKRGFEWAKHFYPSFDMDYAQQLAEKFGLDVHKRIKALSTGYNTIFKFIITLASGVPILIFDEPVLGLDANYRELFYKEVLANYAEEPKTIIISTHLIDEVTDVLEDIIIIKQGEIVLAQSVEEMLRSAYTVSGLQQDVESYIVGKEVIRTENLGQYKSALVWDRWDNSVEQDIKNRGLDKAPVRLQELFISLTNA